MIRHWLTEDFVYKEAVLEFVEIEGAKSRENISEIVLELLHELNIKCKLLLITSNSTLNNETLIDKVDISLQERFTTLENLTNTPRFYSQSSYIRCITHVLN